jgi:hypothetical protein
MKIIDDKFSVGRGFSRIEIIKNASGDYDLGVVFTPHGIVSVYAQGDENYTHLTRIDIVREGTTYVRNFNGKRYSKRGISKVAKAFAKEVFEK